MTFTDLTYIISFIGGIGLFLYGMHLMAEGMQKAAGEKTKKLFSYLTKNRVRGVVVGAAITSIIQSSSATTVVLVGLVNAAVLTLQQAVGVIMGANIGTTMTSWLVSMNEWGAFFKPETFAPLLVGFGALYILMNKSERRQDIGSVLVGFGMLFMGLAMMSSAIAPYENSPLFVNAFKVMGTNPLLAVLVGLVITAVMQSSSAAMGILQTMALGGMVNWGSAVFIAMGSNIGTCVTALLSAVSAKTNAKRVAVIHLLFNVLGALIFGVGFWIFFQVVPSMATGQITSTELAIFHTIFNVGTTVILFPFGNQLVKISEKIVPNKKEELSTKVLDERVLETPAFALASVNRAITDLSKDTWLSYERTGKALLDLDVEKANLAIESRKKAREEQKEITGYMVHLDMSVLTDKQALMANDMLYMITDLERINARLENLAELTQQLVKDKLKFSIGAYADLEHMIDQTGISLHTAFEARETMSLEKVKEVNDSEVTVDSLESELRDKHITRLAQGKCQAPCGVIFLDAISNLERISDHAINIADYVAQELK